MQPASHLAYTTLYHENPTAARKSCLVTWFSHMTSFITVILREPFDQNAVSALVCWFLTVVDIRNQLLKGTLEFLLLLFVWPKVHLFF